MPKSRKESIDPSPKKSSSDLKGSKSKDSQVHPASFFKSMTIPYLVGAGKAVSSSLKCYLGQSKKKTTPKRKIVKSSKNLNFKDENCRQSSTLKEVSTKKMNVVKKSKKHRNFRPMDTLRDDWAEYSKLKGCSKMSIDAKKPKKNKKTLPLFQINKEESSRVSFFSTMMNFKAFTITKNNEEITQMSDAFQGMVADFDKQFLQGLQNADQKFKFRLSREPPKQKTNEMKPFFNSHSDDWNTFNTILRAYFKVNSIPKKRWNKVLLNCIDSPTYKFLKDLCQPEYMNKMTFEELFDILDNHFLSTSEEDIIRVLSKEKYASKMITLEKSRKADLASLDQSVRKKILWSEQELKRNHWKNDDPTDSDWCNGNSPQNDLNEPGFLKSNKKQNDAKKTTKTKLPIVKSLDSTVPPADGRNMIKNAPAVTGILIDKGKETVKCKAHSSTSPNREKVGSPRKSVTFDPKLERIKLGKQKHIRNESKNRKTSVKCKRIKPPDNAENQCDRCKISEPAESGKISDQTNMSSIEEQKWDKIPDQLGTNKTEDSKTTLDEAKAQIQEDTCADETTPSLHQVNKYSLSDLQAKVNTDLNSINKGQYLRQLKEQIFSALNTKTNEVLTGFDTKTESWDVFKEQLNTHLALKRVPYEKWVEFLISTLDSETKQLLTNLSSPVPPEKKKFTDVMVMLDEHFNTIANEKKAEMKSDNQKTLESYNLTNHTGVLIFYFKHGDWSKFKPKIEKHMIDMGLPKSQWAVELLSRLDNKTYKILSYICDPIPPYRKTYEELVDIFDKEPVFISKDHKEKKKLMKTLEERLKTKEYFMSNDAKITFNPETGSWEDFKFKLRTYLEGKAVEKSKWTFELLSRLDPHTYSMVKDKCFTTTPLQMSFESLIEIIDDHFRSSKSPSAGEKNEIQINQRFGSSGDWLSLKKAANTVPNKKVDRWTFALLCGLDCKSYQLLEQACAPDLPEDKHFEELVEILDKYVLAMPSKSKPSTSVSSTKVQNPINHHASDNHPTVHPNTPEIPPPKTPTQKPPTPDILLPAQPQPTVTEIVKDSNKQIQKKKKQGKRTDSLWTLALLNGLNDKVHHLLNALCEPELPNKKSFEEIVDLLDKFLIPMPHKTKSKLKKKSSDNTKFFHYSRIPPFDSKHGEWKTYRKSLTVNFELFDIPKDKWSLAFLSKLDDSVFRNLQTICDPIPPYKKTFEELLEIVDSLFLFKIDDKSDAASEVSWVSSNSQPPSIASKPGDWKTFKEDLKNTLESCKMAKDKWVDILLKSVDAETYKLLQDLCKPDPPEVKTFEELMSVIDHHFLPPPRSPRSVQDDGPISARERITVYHCQQQLSPESQKLNDKLYHTIKSSKIITPKEIPHFVKPHMAAEKPLEQFALSETDQTGLLNGEDIKIAEFNPKQESWFVFKQRLIRDLDILKHPKELWNEMLVQKLDSGTVQILREASKPSRLEHKTFDELVSVLDGYFVPEKDISCLSVFKGKENEKLPTSHQISGFATKIKHWTGYKDRVLDNFKALGIPEKVTSELIKGLDDVIYEVLQSLCEAQYNLLPFKDLCSIFNKEDAEVQTEKGTELQNYPSFDFITGDWKVYKERLTNHLVLYDTPVEKWTYALLSVLNTKDYETLKQLCLPHYPEEKTLKELINILDGFFTVNDKNKSEFIKHCLKREQDCLIAFKDKLKEDVKMLTKLPSRHSIQDKSKHEKHQLSREDPLTSLKCCVKAEKSHVEPNFLKDRSKKKTVRKWKL